MRTYYRGTRSSAPSTLDIKNMPAKPSTKKKTNGVSATLSG